MELMTRPFLQRTIVSFEDSGAFCELKFLNKLLASAIEMRPGVHVRGGLKSKTFFL